MKKKIMRPAPIGFFFVAVIAIALGGFFLHQNSVEAAATNVVGLQMADTSSCSGGVGTARYATDVGTWMSWTGDSDNYDPDCVRLYLGNTIPKDLDIRIGIQSRDINTPCGFLWLSKCGDGGGTIVYGPWASESVNNWSGWACDKDCFDGDQWRLMVDTRPWYGTTVTDFKLGIQVGDVGDIWSGGGGCTEKIGIARYTASSTAGVGWTSWAADNDDNGDYNCVRINLITTNALNDPTAVFVGTSTVPYGNSVNLAWDVEYINTTTGCTLTGRNGSNVIVDPARTIKTNGTNSTTTIAITVPVTYTLFCNGAKPSSTASATRTLSPITQPATLVFKMDPTSGLFPGSTTVATISAKNAAICTLVGKDTSGNVIDNGYSFTPPPPSATLEYAGPTVTVVTFLTSGTSWVVPSNWNNDNNTIEVIGGGGGGGRPNNANADGAGGGGGGSYAKITNLPLTTGASITYQVGGAGAGATSNNGSGGTGGDTWFNSSSMATCVSAGPNACVGAKGGTGGGPINAGSGGTTGSSVGTTKNSGGNGGAGASKASAPNNGSAGGGGAGGPNGAGAIGGNGGTGNPTPNGSAGGGGGGANGGSAGVSGSTGTAGAGGNNRNGTGAGTAGSGGGINGGTGSNGGGGGGGDNAGTAGTGGIGSQDTLWTQSSDSATAGPGGGGGGAGGANNSGTAAVGGPAGGYGGGGGAGGNSGTSKNGGNGTQGIVVITYTYIPTSYITITSGTSWIVPDDWSTSNTIQVIGGGAGGGGGGARGGGGGGAYSKITNTTALSGGQAVTIKVGAGGASNTAGGDTYLCSSTSNCASISGSSVIVGAKGGSTASGNSGGAGGQAASGVGATKNSGGNGNTGSSQGGAAGGGGGGGPNGAGRQGGSASDEGGGGGGNGGGGNGGTADSAGGCWLGCGGPGGSRYGGGGGGSIGDGSNGGAGSTGGGGGGGDDDGSNYRGGSGGNGVDINGSIGSGGGGGGGGRNTGGNGGLYGGGGGGGGSSSNGGTGGGGLIYISYTPGDGIADNTESHTSDHIITQTTDYTVTCTGYDTAVVSQTVRVNLSSCSLNGITIANGGQANFYSQSVAPTGHTCSEYGPAVRTCSNGVLGAANSSYVYGACIDQSNITITANNISPSTSVRKGTSIALSWDGGNADSCSVTGTDGFSSTEISATMARTITQKTVYTATCTVGASSKSKTVTVNLIPSIIEQGQVQ